MGCGDGSPSPTPGTSHCCPPTTWRPWLAAPLPLPGWGRGCQRVKWHQPGDINLSPSAKADSPRHRGQQGPQPGNPAMASSCKLRKSPMRCSRGGSMSQSHSAHQTPTVAKEEAGQSTGASTGCGEQGTMSRKQPGQPQCHVGSDSTAPKTWS